jgi:hypothetical protein
LRSHQGIKAPRNLTAIIIADSLPSEALGPDVYLEIMEKLVPSDGLQEPIKKISDLFSLLGTTTTETGLIFIVTLLLQSQYHASTEIWSELISWCLLLLGLEITARYYKTVWLENAHSKPIKWVKWAVSTGIALVALCRCFADVRWATVCSERFETVVLC